MTVVSRYWEVVSAYFTMAGGLPAPPLRMPAGKSGMTRWTEARQARLLRRRRGCAPASVGNCSARGSRRATAAPPPRRAALREVARKAARRRPTGLRRRRAPRAPVRPNTQTTAAHKSRLRTRRTTQSPARTAAPQSHPTANVRASRSRARQTQPAPPSVRSPPSREANISLATASLDENLRLHAENPGSKRAWDSDSQSTRHFFRDIKTREKNLRANRTSHPDGGIHRPHKGLAGHPGGCARAPTTSSPHSSTRKAAGCGNSPARRFARASDRTYPPPDEPALEALGRSLVVLIDDADKTGAVRACKSAACTGLRSL